MRLVAAAVVLAGLATGLALAPSARAEGERCAVSRAHGDFDADGRRDTAVVYVPRATCRPREEYDPTLPPFHLELQLATGARVDHVLRSCSEACAMNRATDLNGDGRNEVAVLVNQGASTLFMGVFSLQGGHVHRALRPGRPEPGRPRWPSLALGGSVGQGGSVVCRTTRAGTRLVVQESYSARRRPRGSYNVRERRMTFDGSDFDFHSAAAWRTGPDATPRPRGRFCLGGF